MPGLAGTATTIPDRALAADVSTIVGALRRAAILPEERATDAAGRWAIARVHLGHFQPAPQVQPGSDVQVLLHGELLNEAELRRVAGDHPRSGGLSALLVSLYRRFGPAFVEKLQGAFCLCLVDEAKQTVLLASDAVGSYPLYWNHRSGRLTFASSVNALLGARHGRAALDLRAVADYIHFGFVLGDKTLAADVRLLAPGTILTYRLRDDSIALDTYRRLSELFAPTDDTPGERFDRDHVRLEQEIDQRHRLNFRTGGDALVRDGRGHRDAVRPIVARQSRHIGWIHQRHRRHVPRNVADVIRSPARVLGIRNGLTKRSHPSR